MIKNIIILLLLFILFLSTFLKVNRIKNNPLTWSIIKNNPLTWNIIKNNSLTWDIVNDSGILVEVDKINKIIKNEGGVVSFYYNPKNKNEINKILKSYYEKKIYDKISSKYIVNIEAIKFLKECERFKREVKTYDDFNNYFWTKDKKDYTNILDFSSKVDTKTFIKRAKIKMRFFLDKHIDQTINDSDFDFWIMDVKLEYDFLMNRNTKKCEYYLKFIPLK